MDSRDPVVVFFEKSVIQSITLLRKWDFSGQGLHAAPLDRHGGRTEGAICVKVFDPGGRVVCRVGCYENSG